MSFSELEAKIKQLIAIDEIESAIGLLLTHFQNNKKLEEIILLSGIYHSLMKDMAKGTIDYVEVQKTLNKLRASILDFMKKYVESANATTIAIENHYRLSFTKICILWILYLEKDNPPTLNVSKIQAKSKIKNRKHIADSIYEMEKHNLVSKQKVETIICWKLTEKGVALAQEFEDSLLFRFEKE